MAKVPGGRQTVPREKWSSPKRSHWRPCSTSESGKALSGRQRCLRRSSGCTRRDRRPRNPRSGGVTDGAVRPADAHGDPPEPDHPHGGLQAWFARSDGSDQKDLILEGNDFVYVPSGAIHVIANASATEEASLIFCYIGVGNTTEAQTVWLD